MRRGSNAIEFALTLPLFLVVLGGTIHAGIYFFDWAMAAEAARRGCARGAEVAEALADPAATAEAAMDTWLGLAGLDCAQFMCSATLEGASPDRSLRCRISGQPFSPAMAALGAWTFETVQTRRLARQ